MPQTSESTPSTAGPKSSSSGLFGVFKGFTGNKVKTHPSASSESVAESSSPTILLGPAQRHGFNVTTEIETRNASQTWKNHEVYKNVVTSKNHNTGTLGTLIGLMNNLQSTNGMDVRVKAATAVAGLLAEYRITDSAAIWDTAKDMIDENNVHNAVAAGYELLVACVRHNTLTSREKSFFFESVANPTHYGHFGPRFQVLVEVSNHGKNLECLENRIVPLLVHLLKQCFEASTGARKNGKIAPSTSDISPEVQLEQVFQYILDVIKFNSKSFEDKDLQMLVEEILMICYRTTSESCLSRCIDIFDACVTYSYLPVPVIKECITVFCGTYCQIQPLKAQSWVAILNLLTSYHSSSAMNSLLSILTDGPHTTDRSANVVRGAIQVLQALMSSNGEDGVTTPSVPSLMLALKASLQLDSARLALDIMQLLYAILQEEETVLILLEHGNWSDFTNILVECSRRQASITTKHQSRSKYSLQKSTEPFSGVSGGIELSANLQYLVERLLAVASTIESHHRRMVMELLMRLVIHLTDATAKNLVDYYVEERLLLPWNSDWLSNCQILLDSLFTDYSRPILIRMLSLNAICDAYNTGEALQTPSASDLAVAMIGNLSRENDLAVVEALACVAINLAMSTSVEATFDMVTGCLESSLFDRLNDQSAASTMAISHPGLNLPVTGIPNMIDSFGVVVAKALARVFLRSMNRSSWKAQKVYESLLRIAGSNHLPADARIIVLKVLARLRSDVTHAIFLVADTQCQDLAAALCRTTESVLEPQQSQESPVIRAQRKDDQTMRLSEPGVLTTATHISKSGMTGLTRSLHGTGRITKPSPPLWMYPGPSGLPEDPLDSASHLLFSHLGAYEQEGVMPSNDQVPNGKQPVDKVERIVRDSEEEAGKLDRDLVNSEGGVLKPVVPCILNVSAWLSLVLSILQMDEPEWEVYSYVLVHLGAQLTNHSLFINALEQVKLLRWTICNQLSNKSFLEPPSFTSLKKSDVSICMYHILTILVSYHQHFTTAEEDEVVRLFTFGLGTWERSTSETCIHGLSICCHELPASIGKWRENILYRMEQIVSQTQITVHVLEFLVGLARLPELFKDFQQDEFRIVFGICIQYLKDVRYKGDQSSGRPGPSVKPSASGRNNVHDDKIRAQSMEDELPQYVYALAYHVMTFWFMALRLQDRPQQMAYIAKHLVYTDFAGNEVMEEQSVVTLDMMYRIVYSDRDETALDPYFAKPADGIVQKKSWLTGMSIMTIETASRSGISQITRRRPSGTRYSIFRPSLVAPPRHQAPIAIGAGDDSYATPQYVGVFPDDVIQEFYSSFQLSLASLADDSPIPLADDEATQRTLSTFDRIPPLDGHKVGIVYVGEEQTSESEILANVMGSADYTSFLSRIGTLTRLKGATFNTQGLDREFDSDGEFTFCWRDRVTELVFHVTTMMPTNLDHDPNCTNKKRHMGNDFVNIIFNNSGHPFNFETFPSEFNYVNIIIAPEARSSFVDTRLYAAKTDEDADLDLFYKVTVLTKPGLPKISPASETKIVSGKSLPSFVRLMALNASVFSSVWRHREGGEHVSSWLSRLREIVKLRDKHLTSGSTALTAANISTPPASRHGTTPSPVLAALKDMALSKRISASPLRTESAKRLSKMSSAASLQRSGSSGSRASRE